MSEGSYPGIPANDWMEGTPQPHPKHRRDGVPLDGAPDLGLFGTGAPSAEPADARPASASPADGAGVETSD
ncbi:MAG: hypothetical protein JWP19_988 [Rhodoglobus sp.]|nr:hypothetical protein [Rhodoglobus sp.]